MENYTNELSAAHKSLINANTWLVSNATSIANAASEFVSLVGKIEARIAELRKLEVIRKKEDEELEKKRTELEVRQADLEVKENQLNEREQSLEGRVKSWHEIEKRMEENASAIPSIIQLSIGILFSQILSFSSNNVN